MRLTSSKLSVLLTYGSTRATLSSLTNRCSKRCAKCHKRHDKMLRGKKGDEVREHPADNPEPSLDSNIFEGATTRSRVLKGQ